MANNEIVSGRGRAWSLLEKLGEGDAGEVYLVEALLEKERAILKRPHRTAFASDRLRQATQIEREAQALRALANLDTLPACLRTPRLLDVSKAGVEQYERFFIVITQAPGFDLRLMARCRRFGEVTAYPGSEPDSNSRAFLDRLARLDSLPGLLLLRALLGLIAFLEQMHTFEFSSAEGRYHGLIWNDVKPEHLYWEPIQGCVTLIDWGNAAFLDAKGVTLDRERSRLDDYHQVITEMGAFLASEAPELHERLEWPGQVNLAEAYSGQILPLKAKLEVVLKSELAALSAARADETRLLSRENPTYEDFQALDQLQANLVSFGELPDYPGAADFTRRLARRLVRAGELSSFQSLCRLSAAIPSLDPEAWRLLGAIGELAAEDARLTPALSAGLEGDWPEALWSLRLAALDEPQPAWWGRLKDQVRQLQLGTAPETLTPYVGLNRLVHTLQAAAQGPASAEGNPQAADAEKLETLSRELKDVLLKRWTEIEPDPPEAGLAYSEVDRRLESIHELLPEAGRALEVALAQPHAQVQIVLDAWERQDFETARRGLRTLLVWDPDRRRVLGADEAIQAAPEWLREASLGPSEEPRLDFVTRLELEGRVLRNKIGPAAWLDAILETFKSLRKGAEPADVMLQHPELRHVTGWLLELEPSRPLLASSERPVNLERGPGVEISPPSINGRAETALGEDGDMLLGEPLDAWAPEARGSSARVFQGHLRGQDGELRQTAIKLMRPGRGDYALPLFEEEIHILNALCEIPGVTPLLECGFIRLDPGQDLPPEDRHASAYGLSGQVRRIGPNVTRHFLVELSQRTANGWLPYIALEKREPSDNLLLRCDASYTRGRLLPILDGLAAAIQALDLLAEAHARGIVYRDHKILHYYWREASNGLFVIDWNISKLHRAGIPTGEVQFDLVQFSARALHHILAGRPAPGALPLGPNRPEEVEAASRSYAVQWTYDDQRLPQSLKDVIERALAGEYQSAILLREDLHEIFQKLSVLLQS